MKLSIIVPVYNEEKTIEIVLRKLLNVDLQCEKEIICVDDGSTDNTSEHIKRVLATSNSNIIKSIFIRKNKGKGSAIRTGIKKATGKYVLIQDADLEYSPSDIPRLLLPIFSQKVISKSQLAVYGSRFKQGKIAMPFLYILGNKVLTFLTNLLCRTSLTDMETGYKLLPLSFIKNLRMESNHFDIEPEITIKLVSKKIPILEVPISYKGRSHGSGKKLTFMDAFEAIRALFYFRFLNRN